MKLRSTILLTAAATLLSLAPAMAADVYPTKPITLVFPFPPGGADAVGRRIATTMEHNTGATIVPDNQPGAATQVASLKVLQSAPDGYTMYQTVPSDQVMGSVLYSDIPFDIVNDFTLVSYYGEIPMLLLVSKRLGVSTFDEFVAYGKAHPGTLRFASYGALTQNDILAIRMRNGTGMDFDIIPYAGGAPSFNALLSGEVDAVFATPIPTRGFIDNGDMIPIAVTSAERAKIFPDVPTLVEEGLDIVDVGSYGIVGPKGLPDEVVNFWQTQWTKALEDPETKAFVEGVGIRIIASTPEGYHDTLVSEIARWQALADQLGLEKR